MTAPPDPQPAANPAADSALTRLDAWMAASPWHPRAAPFFVYLFGLMLTGYAIAGAFGLPKIDWLYPVVYPLVVLLITVLLWRYRRLTPELNIRFHWLAIPSAVFLLIAWVNLGYATNWLSASVQGVPVLGGVMDYLVPTDATGPANFRDALTFVPPVGASGEHDFVDGRQAYGEAWFWSSMVLRLLGMSLIVPLFEELWVRSAVLRGCFDPRKTWTALIQLASDMPLIGERIAQSAAGRRAAQQPPMFTEQFRETPVGRVSMFAIAMSTIVFMLAHQRRDYAGCIACGVVWCAMVWWTNKPKKGEAWADQPPGGRMGLGPVVWSHGLVNALLWAWTLRTGDWQFL